MNEHAAVESNHLRKRLQVLEAENKALKEGMAKALKTAERAKEGFDSPSFLRKPEPDCNCNEGVVPSAWKACPVCRKQEATNQPCNGCSAEDGTTLNNGFLRCNRCGYPGQ